MRVDIKNFQSIKDLSFELKGFTVITGKSNIGKSAIIRAIKSALCNTKGNYYIREGERECSVSLRDEGVDIQWTKGKTNSYVVNGEAYNSVGFDVPAAISTLGFRPITVGAKELSPQIADQFFPLFLVDQTGSVCAESIFDVSRVNVLNSAQRLLDKDLKEDKGVLKVKQEDLKRTATELSRLEGIELIRFKYEDLNKFNTCIEIDKAVLSDMIRINTGFSFLCAKVKADLEIEPIQISGEELDIPGLSHLYQLDSAYTQSNTIHSLLEGVGTVDIATGVLDFSEYTGVETLHKGYNSGFAAVSALSDVDQIEISSQDCSEDIDAAIRFVPLVKRYNELSGIVQTIVEIPSCDVDDSLSSLVSLQVMYAKLKSISELKNSLGPVEADLVVVDEEIQQVKKSLNVCPLCETQLNG
jgi:energy-coupling factor transporter ATP-binding protein EcfA2